LNPALDSADRFAASTGETIMAYNATGSAGNDTLNQSTDAGPGTIVGLAGDDTISTGTGPGTVTGDNDSVLLQAGNTGHGERGHRERQHFQSLRAGLDAAVRQ
jgi:Ca2+-binding RTX toxin-like protein